MWRALLLTTTLLVQAQPGAPRVPLVAGLTITAAVSRPSGDAAVILIDATYSGSCGLAAREVQSDTI